MKKTTPQSSSSENDDPIDLSVELPGDWTPRQFQMMARLTRRIITGERIWWVLTARGWWVLVLPLLLLAGCAGSATPQIVTQEVTRVVTATPSPRPTATPAGVVPSNWITYTHPAGLFTVAVPALTRATNEAEVGSLLVLPDGSGVVIGIIPESAGQVGSEADIDALVQSVLSAKSTLDTVRVLDRGSWSAPVPANYVELSTTDYVDKTTAYELRLAVPNDSASHFAVNLVTLQRRATEAEKAQLRTILATLRAGR